MKKYASLMAIVLSMMVIAGCTSHLSRLTPLNLSGDYYNYIQPSFDQYVEETENWLRQNRQFITSNHDKELAMNMPFELAPEQPTNKAVLFVHGLGDSPYSFSDLANTMTEQGFYVQTLLLPGHGSKPQDMMLPSYQDWQTMVDHYANLLKQQYDEVWLGGFSTGANLVTIHAIDQGDIDGLLLFSPGFQTQTPYLEKLTPLVAAFWDGYQTEENNLARYNSAPLNGAIAYSDSATALRNKLKQHTLTIPTLIAISEADSIIDPDVVKNLFETRFENSSNQLIWYGEQQQPNRRIVQKSMHLDQYKISTGSHMSPIFAPSNPYYGDKAEKIMCENSFSSDDTDRCNQGEPVWFSAWGYTESGKIHARLTWNPYYNELENNISRLIQSSTSKEG